MRVWLKAKAIFRWPGKPLWRCRMTVARRVRTFWGVFYESGLGVEPDTPRAIAYYEAAIAQGNDRAMTNLGMLYTPGGGWV